MTEYASWFQQLPSSFDTWCLFNCSGILIKTLANASQDRKSLSVPQVALNVIGFSLAVGATVAVTWYAKKRLKELQMQEEELLLR